MKSRKTEDSTENVVLDYDLDAPLEKVWRAITTPALRDHWLPEDMLADPQALSVVPNQEVCYKMRDNSPPFFESIVTFKVTSHIEGRTHLRIIHELTDINYETIMRMNSTVNDNHTAAMCAA